MKTRPFHLDSSISRCLAHNEKDDKPNGCVLANSCHRHQAICSDALDGSTFFIPRACHDATLSMFIPVPAEEEE